MGMDSIQQNMRTGQEVGKFLQERMEAILLDGYVVLGITAGYAVRNPLVYNRKGGDYLT